MQGPFGPIYRESDSKAMGSYMKCPSGRSARGRAAGHCHARKRTRRPGPGNTVYTEWYSSRAGRWALRTLPSGARCGP